VQHFHLATVLKWKFVSIQG